MASTGLLRSLLSYNSLSAKAVNTTGADAVVVISHGKTDKLTNVTLDGVSFSKKFELGNATAWIKTVTNPNASSSVRFSGTGTDLSIGVYVVSNGAGLRGFTQTIQTNYSGSKYINLDIPTTVTSAGNLCVGLLHSDYIEGTYLYKECNWSALVGTVTGDDGRVKSAHYRKSSIGAAENFDFKFAYGGFEAIAGVIYGANLPPEDPAPPEDPVVTRTLSVVRPL